MNLENHYTPVCIFINVETFVQQILKHADRLKREKFCALFLFEQRVYEQIKTPNQQKLPHNVACQLIQLSCRHLKQT